MKHSAGFKNSEVAQPHFLKGLVLFLPDVTNTYGIYFVDAAGDNV